MGIYGLLIFGYGLYDWAFPPPLDVRVHLWGLHANVWWGMLMIVIGTLPTPSASIPGGARASQTCRRREGERAMKAEVTATIVGGLLKPDGQLPLPDQTGVSN